MPDPKGLFGPGRQADPPLRPSNVDAPRLGDGPPTSSVAVEETGGFSRTLRDLIRAIPQAPVVIPVEGMASSGRSGARLAEGALPSDEDPRALPAEAPRAILGDEPPSYPAARPADGPSISVSPPIQHGAQPWPIEAVREPGTAIERAAPWTLPAFAPRADRPGAPPPGSLGSLTSTSGALADDAGPPPSAGTETGATPRASARVSRGGGPYPPSPGPDGGAAISTIDGSYPVRSPDTGTVSIGLDAIGPLGRREDDPDRSPSPIPAGSWGDRPGGDPVAGAGGPSASSVAGHSSGDMGRTNTLLEQILEAIQGLRQPSLVASGRSVYPER